MGGCIQINSPLNALVGLSAGAGIHMVISVLVLPLDRWGARRGGWVAGVGSGFKTAVFLLRAAGYGPGVARNTPKRKADVQVFPVRWISNTESRSDSFPERVCAEE